MDVAITGISCRVPGGVKDPEDLWEKLTTGYNAWSGIPPGRFDAGAFYHPDPSKKGCANPVGGHFLSEDIKAFDAPFFNISAAEAKAMDPDQRMLLELAYEALEASGNTLEGIAGGDSGVFVGTSASGYNHHNNRDAQTAPMFAGTGVSPAIHSNRISYVFNLHGPSFTVDTACSSTLTALHLACQSLRSGETKRAIVAGAHWIATPDEFVILSNLQLLSPSGKCFAFDERATSGFGRGEGGLCLILEPLIEAERHRSPIRALIRASAINQDGKECTGMTAPSTKAQSDLIRQVYRNAHMDLSGTDFVEAHGTGTAVGDPIEIAALGQCFGTIRRQNTPRIGSAKSNFGHLEGASGLLAVAKAAMMVERAYMVPNSNYAKPNRKTPPAAYNLEVSQDLRPWTRQHNRTASVNNFGFGGSNAHIIIQQYSPPQTNGHSDFNGQPAGQEAQHICWFFVLSAHSRQALHKQADSLANYLGGERATKFRLCDLAFTLTARRSKLSWRLCLSSAYSEDLRDKLRERKFAESKVSSQPRIGFVFTGQGAQWARMGCGLMNSSTEYRESIKRAEKVLKALGASWSLTQELERDVKSSRIMSAEISQPACVAVQIALVDVLKAEGLTPSAVVGHSSGEIPAAYAAGSLDQDECLRVAYFRGVCSRVLQVDHPNLKGGMMALGVGHKEAQELLDLVPPAYGHAVPACHNSPKSTTVSGDLTALERIETLANERGLFNRRLKVDTAYHSFHLRNVAEFYGSKLLTLKPKKRSDIKICSSLTGSVLSDRGQMDSEYWVSNLISPVCFKEAVQDMFAKPQKGIGAMDINVLLEIGPHPALKGPVQQSLQSMGKAADGLSYIGTLIRNEADSESLMKAFAELYVRGCKVDVAKSNQALASLSGEKPLTVDNLPPYPWNHDIQYWHDSRAAMHYMYPGHPQHDFLGRKVPTSNQFQTVWRNILNSDTTGWLRDHRVQGDILLPMSAYISLAFEAERYSNVVTPEVKSFSATNVSVLKALVIPESTDVEVMVYLKPYDQETRGSDCVWDEFYVLSCTSERGWMEHCKGLVSNRKQETSIFHPAGMADTLSPKTTSSFEDVLDHYFSLCSTTLDMGTFQERLSLTGLEFGPTFQCLSNIRVGSSQAMAEVTIPDTAAQNPLQAETSLLIHPATLDGCFQLVLPIIMNDNPGAFGTVIPIAIEDVEVNAGIANKPASQLQLFAELVSSQKVLRRYTLKIRAFDLKMRPVFSVKKATFVQTPEDATRDDGAVPKCGRVQWKPQIQTMTPKELMHYLKLPEPSEDTLKRLHKYEQVSYHYISETVDRVKPSQVPSGLEKMFGWMQKQCKRARTHSLKLQSSSWTSMDVKVSQSLKDEVAKTSLFGEFICHVGDRLTEIMKGEVDTLSVLVEEDRLSRMYQNHETLSRPYTTVSQYLDLLAHQNPNLRILEIGAGTGGVTLQILQALHGQGRGSRRLERYMYTDISTGFFEQAKAKFRDYQSVMEFGPLNIEKDPCEQGYERHGFDVIVASNVLHATADIRQTMRNTRQLLKPDGKLALIEVTDLGLSHFPFGTLGGWWLVEDSCDDIVGDEPFRQDTPTLTQTQWAMVLQETGFGGIDGAIYDFEDHPERNTSAIFASAVDSSTHEPPGAEVCIIDVNRHDSSPSKLTVELADLFKRGNADRVISKSFLDCRDYELKDKLCVIVDTAPHSPLQSLTNGDLEVLQSFVHARAIFWITYGAWDSNPTMHMVRGFLNSLRNEFEGLRSCALDLAEGAVLDNQDTVRLVADVFEQQILHPQHGGNETELRQIDGRIQIPRAVLDEKTNRNLDICNGRKIFGHQLLMRSEKPLKFSMETLGDLDSIYFEQDPRFSFDDPLAVGEIEVKPAAYGLNFTECLIALGRMPDRSIDQLGIECAGVVTAVGRDVWHLTPGDHVILTGVGFSNRVRCQARAASPAPAEMPMAVAAAITAVYCTVYYALFEIGRLAKDETILIHSAAGGVGQAAICLSRMVGARIFATVGSEEKRDYLVREYGLSKDHIFYSRSTAFKEDVLRATSGRGVDVVLNSLAGELLKASWQLLASYGRFLELGKKDAMEGSRLDMRAFNTNRLFAAIDFSTFADERPDMFQALKSKVVDLVASGTVKPPQPITKFPMNELGRAIRSLAGGKTTGKIVIEVGDQDRVRVSQRLQGPKFSSQGSYLITGGTGGIGRAACEWMVENGAKYVVLASRSGIRSDAAMQLKQRLESTHQVSIDIRACDLGNRSHLEHLALGSGKSFPPVKGIIHGAMYLKDRVFEQIDSEHWNSHIRPKVMGSIALYELFASRSALDFYLLLSSQAGIRGNPGQTPYAACSTFQDGFATYLRARGVPATTISVGIVEEVGYVAEREDVQKRVAATYGSTISRQELFEILNSAISNTMQPQCLAGISLGDIASKSPIFAHLRRYGKDQGKGSDAKGTHAASVKQQIADAGSSPQKIKEVVREAVLDKFASILMIAREDIIPAKAITAYGVDSLVAVELRNWINRELAASMSLPNLMASVSIEALIERIVQTSSLCLAATPDAGDKRAN